MQITLSLPKAVVTQLQQLPNPDKFVSEVVRKALSQRNQEINKPRVLPVFHGDGLQPGVDLNNARQLQARMDEDGFLRFPRLKCELLKV